MALLVDAGTESSEEDPKNPLVQGQTQFSLVSLGRRLDLYRNDMELETSIGSGKTAELEEHAARASAHRILKPQSAGSLNQFFKVRPRRRTPTCPSSSKTISSTTDKLSSKMRTRNAGKVLLRFYGPTARVSSLTENRQRGFATTSVAKGQKLSYVARNMVALHAALVYAKVSLEVTYTVSQMERR
jgi:hypothetical protein